MKEQAILQKIENDHKVVWGEDSEFLFAYHRALLLALKELGLLTEIQHRYAQEKLNEQRRTFLRTNRPWEPRTGRDPL